jgi:(1->4)-alpha-D-glucan 1-alpha-D-glucosylmutase
MSSWPDERIKMFLIWRTLRFRQTNAALEAGSYLPLAAEGPRNAHVCAFARMAQSSWALCVVPRFVCQAGREDDEASPAHRSGPSAAWWQGTSVSLPPDAPRRFRHILTDAIIEPTGTSGQRSIDVGGLLQQFPVALLEGTSI